MISMIRYNTLADDGKLLVPVKCGEQSFPQTLPLTNEHVDIDSL